MRASFSRSPSARRGFTLVEVLAALMLMGIVIPVAMQGMGIASRAGVLAQRKAAAMRVADRVLNELIVTSQAAQAASSGTVGEGETVYAWTLESQTWSEDALTQLTVRVTFQVQGDSFSVAATTLIDPTAGSTQPVEEVTP